jgi:hypothetical protein
VIAFILGIALVSSHLQAMNMPVYDLHSKVYLSTDIVIVQVSIDEAKHKIATVQESLLGTLAVGARLDKIDGYLSYFDKINSGDRLILFLDSRSRKLNFIYKEFEKSPYAIVPSGVELVDPFGHVHSYYQPMNPGGYFPIGYSRFPDHKPFTEEDAFKFPTLGEEKKKILDAIRVIEPARAVLGHDSTVQDLPRLLHFVDRTSSNTSDCAIRTASAIREDAIQHIKQQNDPDLLLRAETLAGEAESWIAAETFFSPMPQSDHSEKATKEFKEQRARFLLNVLADKNKPVEVRRTALFLLLYKSAWGHPYSGVAKVFPIDSPELAPIASRIIMVSRTIFSDTNDDAVLRGLCLRFLDLDEQTNIDLAIAVYKKSSSDALRFEIEDVLLSKSDQLFLELAPPYHDATSIISLAPRPSCVPETWPEPMFSGLYREHGYQNNAHRTADEVQHFTALINRKTGKIFKVDEAQYGSSSDGSGWGQFAINNLEEIPAGEYSIQIQFELDGKEIGAGYGLNLNVVDESGRKRIVIDSERAREYPYLKYF